MRARIRLIISAALVLAASIALAGCSANGPKASTETSAVEAPIEVSTAPVIQKEMVRSIETVGSLEAEDEVTLSSQSAGELAEIRVDIGATVRRGQIIGRLDSRELKLRVQQSEAALRQAEARAGFKSGEAADIQNQTDVRQAKAALERARYDWTAYQQLVEHGDISRQQLDVARRAFEQAEARYQSAIENARNLLALVEEKRAQLALAQKQAEDANIVSPINGAVKEKLASRGEYLQPGKPVVTIVQINPLRLKLDVPEAFTSSVRTGQKVMLSVDTFPDREFQATVKRISPSLDEKNRSLTVEAEVLNPQNLLKPGMFARARIVSDAQSEATMVPEKAVVTIAGINKIFVLDGERAVERLVKLGARDGSLVEIVEGVRAGERVITSLTERLQDGALVSAS